MNRDPKSAQPVHVSLNGIRASAGLSDLNDELANCSKNAEDETRSDNVPRPRPRAIDIQSLCSTAPFRVPAKPWTTVTDSDDLVSHLVSLYLTWGYPFYAFFCREAFVKHMSLGNVNTDFCSPFLVNALLANACFYADYSEAYSLPGDVKRKGAQFLAEAESHLRSHQYEGRNDIRLSSLQAILLLYERYSLSGQNDYGYTMLYRAIGMAESIGIVNNHRKTQLETSQFSEDMRRSLKRTAWGLFQIDTIVHMNFLKACHIISVNVDPIAHGETQPDELWIPYPLQADTQPSYMSFYFEEACRLSYIARDTSWEILRVHEDDNFKQEQYRRLCEWDRNLPTLFEPEKMPTPYILVLRMRYHTLVINLCCHGIQADISSVEIDEHTPGLDSSDSESAAIRTAVSSAREIAALVRTFKKQYGLEHSHQFAMYAINVSLFCLVTQVDFDFLDPDFLSLTEAFSRIACRSQVGRHLFHTFKLSIRTSIRAAQVVPPVLKEFFEPREKIHEPDKWDQYAEALAEVDGEGGFLKDLEMDPVVPNLTDMLHWYERLSIGEAIEWRKRNNQPAF